MFGFKNPLEYQCPGFLTAAFPDANTVGPVRELLQVGRHELPEDKLDIGSSSYFSRDVYLLAIVSHQIAFGKPPQKR